MDLRHPCLGHIESEGKDKVLERRRKVLDRISHGLHPSDAPHLKRVALDGKGIPIELRGT